MNRTRKINSLFVEISKGVVKNGCTERLLYVLKPFPTIQGISKKRIFF